MVAGLPGAIASVPDGMASAVLAGVNPVHGLYASFAGPVAGGMTASTKLMVITTTTASALAAGSAVKHIDPVGTILVPLITAIGASLFIQYTFRGLYGSGVRSYPPIPLLQGSVNILGVELLKTQAIVIVSAVLMMVGLYFFVQRTRTGRAMRAVSEDKDVAAMMGINVDRVIATTFAIGGLLAGATGILYVMLFNIVSFSMGFLPGIKAFTAAVLGGIGNIVGAMIGGILLGLLESIGPRLLLSGFGVPAINQLRDVVAFTVLVLVLIFRPYGLLGRKE
jgi:branched-chain amino acid transport system permease protein